MKNIALFLLLLPSVAFAQSAKKQVHLSSGKVLFTPAPGNPQAVDSFPTTAVLSPDQRHLVLLNAGYGTQAGGLRQGLTVLDTATNQPRFFPDNRLAYQSRQTYFLGLAFSSDGSRLYASIASRTDPLALKPGSTGNGIAVYNFENADATPERFIKIPPQPVGNGKMRARGMKTAPEGTIAPFPAGLAVIARPGAPDQILVADNTSDDVLLLDSSDGRILRRFDLSTSDWVPAAYPYNVVVNKAGTRAWCSLWNASRVVELDLQKGKIARSIPLREPKDKLAPGSHPTALLLDPPGRLLFVALANTDEVAVVRTDTGKVVRYLSTKLRGQTLWGSIPNALAINAAATRLFVANGGSDSVAVFDIKALRNCLEDCKDTAAPLITRESSGGTEVLKRHPLGSNPEGASDVRPIGHIPTESYPTALAVKGGELFIVSGKAQGTGPNNMPATYGKRDHPYIGWLLHGSVARVSIADSERNLAALTREAEESNLMSGRADTIPFHGGRNPIRHVLYIIKENRTYDQLFGDISEANGDPSLVMYGEDVTPNHHALARQFGVLDNFYDSGEVSGDGHVWSNAAITSDFTQQTWQIAYHGSERIYDSEGRVMDEFPMEQGISDINEPQGGYLWANAARHKLNYRNYGEFVPTTWCRSVPQTNPQQGPAWSESANCARKVVRKGEPLPAFGGLHKGEASPWPWEVPIPAYGTPAKIELRNHASVTFPWFDLMFPDQYRADIFLEEFQHWVKDRADGHDNMPALMTMSLSNDHTAGTAVGRPRPRASVADNDLALGRIVEAISNSPYWDDTAILVLEDDAQNGADHVDAHRSIALVISKYAPLPASGHPRADQPALVHSQFYTTVNMVRTAEVLLGLPPMNNNDAHAAVMAPLFNGPGSQPAFHADFRNRDNAMIYETNEATAPGAAASRKLDFSRPDAADAEALNRILWQDAKGARPYPAPKHTVIPAKLQRDTDD